jgi:hypothetical protein
MSDALLLTVSRASALGTAGAEARRVPLKSGPRKPDAACKRFEIR